MFQAANRRQPIDTSQHRNEICDSDGDAWLRTFERQSERSANARPSIRGRRAPSGTAQKDMIATRRKNTDKMPSTVAQGHDINDIESACPAVSSGFRAFSSIQYEASLTTD